KADIPPYHCLPVGISWFERGVQLHSLICGPTEQSKSGIKVPSCSSAYTFKVVKSA
ncbi:hypothetical protein CU097_013490, partial [Rhizopus azygosporus]